MAGRSALRSTVASLKHALFREVRPALQAMAELPVAMLDARHPERSLARLRRVQQRVLEWATGLPALDSLDELADYLTAHGLRLLRDQDSLYVSPQPERARVLGAWVEFYPRDAVLRIVGESAEQQADALQLLYVVGVGPRVYDRARLMTASRSFECVVIEQVVDDAPDCSQRLQRLTEDPGSPVFGMQVDAHHLVPPDRQANLSRVLHAKGAEFHFGGTRLLRGGRYLYQSVPGLGHGKRDTQPRWTHMEQLLANAGLSVENRVVLDFGCNAGMFLASALAKGASWGLGWDTPSTVAAASQVQAVLGNSRLDLIGAHLDDDFGLVDSIPAHLRGRLDGSVVFYLAVWRWMGFLPQLATVPWKAMVFEGHQADSAEQHDANLRMMEQDWGCRVAERSVVLDGDSQPRPLALLVRDP